LDNLSLKVDQLGKRIHKSAIIDQFSLSIGRQKRVALLGLNGAGKSSLIRLLVGESNPDNGSIRFYHQNQSMHPCSLDFKKLLGYQADTMLDLSELSAGEYLEFCAHSKALSQAEFSNAIASVNDCWPIENLLNTKMSVLSKGNLQKIAIAQVFLNRPQFLLFDEPCQSLDPMEQNRFNQMLKDLHDFELCLFSTHNVEHALEVADEIILFHQSRIAYHWHLNEVSGQANNYLIAQKAADSNILDVIKQSSINFSVISEQLYRLNRPNLEQVEQLKQQLKYKQYQFEFCLPEKQALNPLFRLLASGEIQVLSASGSR